MPATMSSPVDASGCSWRGGSSRDPFGSLGGLPMSDLISSLRRPWFAAVGVSIIAILVVVMTRAVPAAARIGHSDGGSSESLQAWPAPESTVPTALPPELQAAVDNRFGAPPGVITPTPTGAMIDNPAQQIAVTIDGRGLTLGEGCLAVQAWGRDERDLIRTEAGTVTTTADRVIIQRSGLHEVVTTSAIGLRHDMVVEDRPPGDGELVVEIGCKGGRFESKDANGAELVVAGRRMTYDRLRVSDADGKGLAARMQVIDGTVRIHVQDASARYPVVVDPTISATGSLATGRDKHTATLLLSGKVLVVAGDNHPGFLTSCELYDPSTGAWSATGSLTVGRDRHTATLLPSGKVLVTGGSGVVNNFSSLTSCELYDPVTGTWTATGSLATMRFYHTATLLHTGKVLVVGGYRTSGPPVSTCELYDPATGMWTSAGSLATARYYHAATMLPSGKVLIAGGWRTGPLSSCELYDPSTGAW